MNNKLDVPLPAAQKSKQKSIHLGLQSVLTADDASEVLEEWSTYFNDTDSIFNGLNSFAREVCQRYGIPDQQRNLLRALHRSLLHAENDAVAQVGKDNVKSREVVEASVEISDGDYTAPLVEQAISSPEFLTFKSLLLKILDSIKKYENEKSTKLHLYLIELIHGMPWSESQQNQLLTLIKTGDTIQVRTYKPDQLKTFVKHLRNWIEDEVGIPDAAKIINEAIEAIQSQPVGRDYSAKKFV